MRASGIYKITCLISSKFYIGSATYIKSRWARHRADLRKNKHWNKHIQSSWNKYGEVNFTFEVIEECNKHDLLVREQYYLDNLKPQFNKSKFASSCAGVKVSEETKEKLRQIFKGRSPSNKGIPRSEETKQRLKDAWILRRIKFPLKPKLKRKYKKFLKNKYSSKDELTEAKRKYALERKRDSFGRLLNSNGDSINNMVVSMKGKKHTDDTKAKLKAAWIRRKARGEVHLTQK